mgnify:FL=1
MDILNGVVASITLVISLHTKVGLQREYSIQEIMLILELFI